MGLRSVHEKLNAGKNTLTFVPFCSLFSLGLEVRIEALSGEIYCE
jgi:hypothetical protein